MKYRWLIISIAMVANLLFTDQAVLASNIDQYYGLNDLIDQGARLGNKDLVTSVAGLINIFLGFLGVIAILFIIYGGFIWMTSKGSAEKIQKAKLIIISAVVGIAIILSAYAISRYVIERIVEGVGGGGGGGPVIIVPPVLPTCPEPVVPTDMRVCRVQPSSGGVDSVVTIYGWHFGAYDAANSYVTFDNGVDSGNAEVVTCGPNITWQQTATPGYYIVKVRVPNLPVAPNYSIEVGNNAMSSSDVWPDAGLGFSITPAAPGPGIYCISPDNGPRGQTVDIFGVRFGAGSPGDQIFMDADAGPDLSITNFGDAGVVWSDNQITFNIKNDAISSELQVKASGLDSNPDYFQVTCASDADCASGCCLLNSCRASSVCDSTGPGPSGPFIDSLDPNNGAVGNLITVRGANFGAVPGSVYFSDGAGNPILADVPAHPQCTLDYWHDDYIVVQVPAGTADGQVSVTTAATEDSNAVNFDENGIVRPGLCKVDPNAGLYGDSVSLYGNNFTVASDDILFGGVSGDNNVIVSATDASTVVPNLQGGVVAMQIETVSGEESNSLPFTVLTVAGGLPIINSVSPNPAPPGQYVTIMGANFGSFAGQVDFGATPGDFNFPAQCRDSFWQNDRIVVKVPAVANGSYGLVVTRNSDGATNNTPFNFSVNNAIAINPGICKMQPSNGPAGTAVDFFGDNFGNAPGTVRFHNNQAAAGFTIWNNQQVLDAIVPLSAETGPVVIVDSSSNVSNQINFSVGSCPSDQFCIDNGLGSQCCSGNAGNYCANSCDPIPNQCLFPWTITSEADPFGLRYSYCGESSYQTPTPWPHDAMDNSGLPHTSLDSYVDTNVMVNFTRNVNDTDLLNPANLRIYQCNTGGAFNNGACGGLQLAGSYEIVNDNSNEEGVMFDPTADLLADTWYRVDFGTFNAAVGGDVWPSVTNPAPAYHFKTRANDDACVPTAVSVSPQSPAADVFIGQSRTFTALPTASNCNICGKNYNWNWTKISDPSPQPLNNTINPVVNSLTPKGTTVFTGGSRSDPNPVVIEAELTDFGISATTQSVVRAQNLAIVDYGPDCVPACRNAEVFVQFNIDVDSGPANVNITNFDLRDSSGNPAGFSTLMPLPNRVNIVHNPFVNGETYTVTVSGNVISASGDTLGADFSWSFTVGDASECVIDSAEVLPASYVSTFSGEAVPYTLIATTNITGCGSVPVVCDAGCSYSWSSDNVPVANVFPNNVQSPVVISGVNGTANITGTITHNGVPFSDVSVFDVNAVIPNSFNFNILPNWQPPDNTPACRNAAVVVDFSAQVDRVSVENGMGLYEFSETGGPGCIPQAIIPAINGFFCPFSGSFFFQDLELDGIDPELETRVIFNPSNLLKEGWLYLVLVESDIQSLDPGGIFVPGALPQIDVDGGGNDGYGWTFPVSANICQINSVSIMPAIDTFTCAYNDGCPDDFNIVQTGNQHGYFALPFDIAGNLINFNFITNVNWGVVGSLVTLGTNGNFFIEGTAGTQNGTETLTVTMSGPTVGSGSGSSRVDLFLCVNPWPNAVTNDWSPWQESDYNFSTHYCQANSLTEPALPTLPEPYSFVNNNISPEVIREYIFFIDPSITLNNSESPYPLGTLARSSDKRVGFYWWHKILSWIEPQTARGAMSSTPPPTDLRYSVSGPNAITLSWNSGGGPAGLGYDIQKKLLSETIWTTIANINSSTLTFTDNSLAVGDSYSYRVGKIYSSNIVYSNSINIINFGVQQNVRDIIGFRIMRNDGHMSVLDWYRRNAPNADVSGNLTEINGYEALVVGDSTYVAAANINAANRLYTNIYIFAHNIGAQPETLEIYSQLIENLRFNTNLINNNNNVCAIDSGVSCTNDFECLDDNGFNVGPCLASGLKLRRDMKRLGGMLEVKNLVEDYGISHKACSNNANIQCTQDSDCPSGGFCVYYYPLLNAGSFIPGLTTSKWPVSWDGTLSDVLGMSLPVDPINRFNGCPANTDPETCWDEINREFQCGLNSMVYVYQSLASGRDYRVTTNFEYDMLVPGTFASRLMPDNGVNNIPHLSANLNAICAVPISNPPGPGNAGCGNGIVEGAEECDSNYIELACRANVGLHNWWNEQRIGCYPPGYIDTANNLLECTWYDPVPPLDAAICGGYCGDGDIQPFYELCEGANFNNVHYSCPGGVPPSCAAGICQPTCPGNVAASACGDGEWTENAEECDASANPDGLVGWSCSNGGTLRCSSQCLRSCDVGVPSNAICGNNVTEPTEACDYTDWTAPLPQNATVNNAYTCSSLCNFVGQPYCGNGIREAIFGEECDAFYVPPIPSASNINRQYQCGVTPSVNACKTRAGGYCGDNIIQGTYDEICDTLNHTIPSPAASGPNLQYQCGSGCLPNTGGYCGDGSVSTFYGEECDPNSSDFMGWGCTMGGVISCTNACGRQCSVGVPIFGV